MDSEQHGQGAAALAAVLTILAGAAWLACARPWAPVSDLAIIETQVQDVGRHTPLVGPYSRFGWNHPGPWMFWLLALPYRLAGARPAALLVGVALINAVAVVGIARVARRRGGLPLLLLTLTALALLLRAVGLGLLTSPWNPYLPLLPFTWFLFLVWDAACGHRWSLPLAVGVGSFVAQCHVGCALPAGTLLALGMVLVLAGQGRNLWSPIAASAAVAAALWLPVVVEEIANDPGNLTLLWRFFFAGVRPSESRALGPLWGATILARELVGFAPWMGGPEWTIVPPLAAGWLVIPGLALGGAGLLAYRRGDDDVGRGLVIAAAGTAVAWLALAAIVGLPFSYVVRWTWGVALFFDVMVLWGLVPMIVALPARFSRVAGWSVVAALLGVSATTLVRDRQAELPGAAHTRSTLALTPPVVGWIRAAGARSVLLERELPSPVFAGLMAALERDGIAVAVPDRLSNFPRHRRVAGRSVDAELVVVSGPEAIHAWSARPGATAVASYWPATDGEQHAHVRPVGVFARIRGSAGSSPGPGSVAPR